MGRFKKSGSGELPAINTGSMGDIIFILLFFFMVITTMRESSLLVKISTPRATEVHKIEKKSLVSNIYIGPPLNSMDLGTEPRIQLNDQIADITEVRPFILADRESRDEADRPFITTSLKVDKTVKMRIVTSVKQELRQVGAFRLNYSTTKTATVF